jgi:hypothetical protein
VEEAPEAEEPVEVEPAPGPMEEDEDIETERGTDWNVPSWQELIASLYRPDR